MRNFDLEWFRTIVQLRHVPQSVIRVLAADTGLPIANAKISSGWIYDDGVAAVSGADAKTSSGWIYDDGVAAVTGADGTARLNVQLPANLTIEADSYATAREFLDRPGSRAFASGCPRGERTAIALWPRGCGAPAQVTREVRLSGGIVVSGSVIGPEGNAVEGAHVVVSGPTSAPNQGVIDARANTDASGRFEMRIATPGRYLLTADRRDLANEGPVGVDVPARGRADLVARLVRRAGIRGTVIDGRSNPVAGARVSVANGGNPPVIADASGRFVFDTTAGSVDIIANHGTDTSAFQRVQLGPGEQREVVLQLGPSGISGVAVDQNGSPVEGAEVWLNGCCAWNPNLVPGKRITTDSTGKFAFDTPRGDFVLSVKRTSDDDYVDDDDLKVTGGSHDIQLRVP